MNSEHFERHCRARACVRDQQSHDKAGAGVHAMPYRLGLAVSVRVVLYDTQASGLSRDH
jgi:hypothetical protein